MDQKTFVSTRTSPRALMLPKLNSDEKNEKFFGRLRALGWNILHISCGNSRPQEIYLLPQFDTVSIISLALDGNGREEFIKCSMHNTKPCLDFVRAALLTCCTASHLKIAWKFKKAQKCTQLFKLFCWSLTRVRLTFVFLHYFLLLC